jgi:hypothetical protein
MQRDSTVTPASDDRIVLDQYGAVAGVDGGDDPVSTLGRLSGILPSTSITSTPLDHSLMVMGHRNMPQEGAISLSAPSESLAIRPGWAKVQR